MIGSTNSIWKVNGKYEQLVNYTMLYDGSLGDTTLNQCSDVTGGWTSGYVYSNYKSGGVFELNNDFVLYGEQGNGYDSKYASPRNKINMDEYTTVFIKANTYNYNTSGINNGNKIRLITDTTFNAGDPLRQNNAYVEGEDFTFLSTTTKGWHNYNSIKDISSINGEVALALYTFSGASSSDYMYTNCYELAIFKADDWQTLAELSGITASSIEDILTNSVILLSNKDAVEFMIKQCTGDFMASAVQSETFLTALNNSQYKTIIWANEHWAKFLNMIS